MMGSRGRSQYWDHQGFCSGPGDFNSRGQKNGRMKKKNGRMERRNNIKEEWAEFSYMINMRKVGIVRTESEVLVWVTF